jgi:hypothetical protein
MQCLLFYSYRETGSIEKHAEALVALLESCLCHSLAPSSKGEDPPHTKIASDVLSCIFLVSSPPFLTQLIILPLIFLLKYNS